MFYHAYQKKKKKIEEIVNVNSQLKTLLGKICGSALYKTFELFLHNLTFLFF